MLANVVEGHNGNPGEHLGIVVDVSPKDDKVIVYAINSEDPTSKDVPRFPTHGERLETGRIR